MNEALATIPLSWKGQPSFKRSGGTDLEYAPGHLQQCYLPLTLCAAFAMHKHI